MMATGGHDGDRDLGTAVRALSYTEATRELDEIVAFFEQREVDVDQLVARLERATAIVDELDRRLRRTRAQVEELVPKLQAAASPERDSADLMDEFNEIEVEEIVGAAEPLDSEADRGDPNTQGLF